MGKNLIIGDVVYAVVDPRMNNGDDVAAAMITKVKDGEDKQVLANLRVFLDTGADQRLTNVQVYDKRPKAEADDVPMTVEGVQRVAFRRD